MRRPRFRFPVLRRFFRREERALRWISIESLEDRTVPAVVLWDGGAGTANWQDALNWSNDALPTSTDDVQILGAGSAVTLSSGSANVASVLSDRDLSIAGASLTANTIQVNSSLLVGTGGSIQNARILAGTGTSSVSFTGGSLVGVQLDAAASASGAVNISSGLILNNRLTLSAKATFVGTQSITGNGDIYFSSTLAALSSKGDGTSLGAAVVTIGPGIIVHGSTNGSISAFNVAYDSFINQGIINADSATSTITISYLNNQGSIIASLGSISVRSKWTNSGDFTVSGGNFTVRLGSSYGVNSGVFNLSAGTLNLDGSFQQSEIGTLNRTGGSIYIVGTLNGDLSLNATIGNVGLKGGLSNSTYTSIDGASLTVLSGTLIYVTLGSDLQAVNSFTMSEFNLNGHTLTLAAPGTSTITFFGSQGTQITGPGEIVVSGIGTTTFKVGPDIVFTIGAGVVIHGTGELIFDSNYVGSHNWNNYGVIRSEAPGKTWLLKGMDNRGTIEAAQGTINRSGAQANSGTLIASGGTLSAGSIAAGTLIASGGTLSVGTVTAGSISVTGGTMNVSVASPGTAVNISLSNNGILNLGGTVTQSILNSINRTGGILFVTGTFTGDLSITGSMGGITIGPGGTLKNSFVSAPSDGYFSVYGGTLDNVTFGINVTVDSATIKNGLNLNGHTLKHVSGAGTSILFSGTQTISGPGEIQLNAAPSTLIATGGTSTTNSTVTIGADVTIRVINGIGGVINVTNASYDRWVNLGSLVLNGGSATLSSASRWTNLGSIIVDGATLTIANGATDAWSNAGTISLISGFLNLGGIFTQAGLGTFYRSGGVLLITGTMTGDLSITGAMGGITVGASGTLKNSVVSAPSEGFFSVYGGTLDNVTLGVDITVDSATIKNGLNLNGHILKHISVAGTSILFSGTQTISGPGEIQLNAAPSTLIATGGTSTTNSTVTIGADVIIRVINGNGGAIKVTSSSYDQWVNLGSLVVNGGSTSLNSAKWTNLGSIIVDGGTLAVGANSGAWSNAGTISLISGYLKLGGIFTQAGLGVFNRSGGVLLISGVWTGDINLTNAIGWVALEGGTIKNGVISAPNSDFFSISSGGTLDNVTLGIDISTGGYVTVLNGLNLNGHNLTLTNNYATFRGTQTISGAGEIRANSTSPITIYSSGAGTAATASIVTIGSGVIIHGTGSYSFGVTYPYDRFINQGTILADTAGQTVTLRNVDNYGLIALAGGMMSLTSDYTQYAGETRLGGANPTIDGSTRTVTIAGGVLTGSGTIAGNLVNGGDVSPGTDSAVYFGTINVGGTYVQQASGRLIVDLYQGGARDQLNVTGAATIDGTVIVNRRNDNLLDELATYPILTASSLVGTFSNLIDGDSEDIYTYSIGYSPTSAFLTIPNLPPWATASGALNVAFGSIYTLNLSAWDTSPSDSAANFTYDIDWDGDGIFDQTAVLNSGPVTHLYSDVGEYDIRVRATDIRGATGDVQMVPVNVFGYMLQQNSLNPLLTDLVWSGTSGADSVSFEQTGVDQVTLRTSLLNNVATSTTQVINGVTGRVIGLGQKGNDFLDASLLSSIPTELRGGGGADTIIGGAGENVLYGDSDGGEGGNDSITGGGSADTIYADGSEGGSDTIHAGDGNDTVFSDPVEGAEGGADLVYGDSGDDLIDAGTGNDTVDGGDGRDVIIGGGGADSLKGGLGEDLLVSGMLAASFYSNQQQGIKQVAEQWQSADLFATRVDYLQGTPGGIISPSFVLAGAAILNDSSVDEAITNDDGESDWILADAGDTAETELNDRLDLF